jgi:formylglycine-generating enzyme required for sulfatase activity
VLLRLAAGAALLLLGCGGEPAAPDADTGPTPGMVPVPAGTVMLGDPAGAADEMPVRQVMVSAFQIDRLEATQSEWKACIDAGGCGPVLCQDSPYWNPATMPAWPAICMTWAQASEYCAWQGKRLPTEAEWERAARGDGAPRWAWGDEPPTCAHANLDGCGNVPMDVGGREAGASPFGVLDMTGNVREWTADWYAADAYARLADTTDPTGPTSGSERVVRGGGFNSLPDGDARAAARDALLPIGGAYDLGVRCVK